jgi:hypothetical protein
MNCTRFMEKSSASTKTMLGRFVPAGTAGAGPSVSFGSGGGGCGAACDGGVRLPEVRIAGPARSHQFRADLRQRLGGAARLGPALHDGANAVQQDAIARPGGATLEPRLLAGRGDLPAWPLARALCNGGVCAQQDYGGADRAELHSAWPHRHHSRFELGFESRGEVLMDAKSSHLLPAPMISTALQSISPKSCRFSSKITV